MTIFDMPNYMTYTIIGMVVLTLLCNFALNKWFTPAVITFVVLGVVAFFIPNFVNISYEPLLGYAAFLAVVSLLISFLSWFTTRNWRKKRREKKREKEIRKRGGIPKEDVEAYQQERTTARRNEPEDENDTLSRVKRNEYDR